MNDEVEEIRKFIEENPEFRDILEQAVNHERSGDEKQYYLGWQWNVGAHPAKLTKCLTSGVWKQVIKVDVVLIRNYQTEKQWRKLWESRKMG